ncbi:bifunctional (p)ppGpp synthetase/guanosine-3',5'-bis(diphosphate) 3'-pyrophosphohydrolase [Chelatococcus sambhunathii]|uniref:GTP pyrophosphokinase rsh n=1 Tax=Chelatococcus sambhunathii TaxID=363953 RepID=A0ABU1DK06_9HYPH|nr:bifunctional (p)ppGpp synthetase/guanosine-3',5'-bis(diphosphate) 3'-pyrophosphohydrolase [Chelatococcus sambhunathii]MDR4308453.1 bifunctional (p)ppGpp synthetase/guanosine-3',5'-bis(diphosphate) 3'-pyrophosphohydrolase [Chelatococcus sambhunathii]
MMRQYELVERVRAYNPNADEALLNRGYVYAMRAHGSQTRASGDPYFSHPLEVAAILTDLKLDDATIVAALLHDTVEDTEATHEEIDQLFGPQIAQLVDGLTKLKKLDLVTKEAAQAENLRRLLLAIAADVRVLLVKLADRLHNMRTLHFVPPAKRARIAQETLDLYAPLAGRMGMQQIRDELEDICFRTLFPDAYQSIVGRLNQLAAKSAQSIEEIKTAFENRFRAEGIDAVVTGRAKKPYSIWRKMERKSIAFEQLSDVFAFRVIAPDVPSCYRSLGAIHTGWPTVPGRFKDYISTPKQNDYRSIHTTVVGPGHQRVELQIRTEAMHRFAEYGIAAHALYKDNLGSDVDGLARESRAYGWLRRTVELLAEGDNPEEFLEHTKLELFSDQVFCFTPKGRLIALPRGATPIDFAYAVHTNVGNECVGAKVNGRNESLVQPLNNGDEVEIIRSEGQTPPAAWEAIVVTGKARAAIRRASRSAIRAQYAGLGRQIIQRAFERAGQTYSEDKLRTSLHRLARTSVEDVLAAVGRGEMHSLDVVRSVYPDVKDERSPTVGGTADGWFALEHAGSLRFKAPGDDTPGDQLPSIPIRGLRGDLPVRFAPNGGAVPGDRIVGILEPGQGITIYPIQSPALKDFDDQPERWLDVRWDVDPGRRERYPVRIQVTSLNEPGSLALISGVFSTYEANIDDVRMISRSPDFHDIVFDLGVFDAKHLGAILADLRQVPVVSNVERVNG